MGIFSKNVVEERAVEYQGFFVEQNTETEIQMDESTSMEIPSFSNAIETIVTAISRLDIKLYQEDEKGKVQRHINDYRLKLLNEENSFYGNAVDYKKQIVRDMLLNGISYSYLDKKGLEVDGIYRLNPKDTTLEQSFDSKGIPTSIKLGMNINGKTSNVDLEDILVIPFRSEDGITGKSIFEKNQRILKLMYQELEYHEYVYKNASVPFGVLEMEGKANKDIVDRLKATWSNLYKGSKNSGKIAVLENGLKYKAISQNPQDVLLLDSRKANISEIEKIFNLPSGMLESGNMDLELLQGYFKNKTIEPILKLIEESLNKALLLESEKAEGYYFRFDPKPLGMVRGKDFIDSIVAKVSGGISTINEARAELDMDDFMNSDDLIMSLGHVMKKPNGATEVPNMDGGTNDKKGIDKGLE